MTSQYRCFALEKEWLSSHTAEEEITFECDREPPEPGENNSTLFGIEGEGTFDGNEERVGVEASFRVQGGG